MTTPEGSADSLNDEEAQIAKINEITEQISQLREQMEESLIPVRTTSFNGFGIMLLDYRPVEDGNYEVTRWITACFLPLIPLSVWKICPKKYKYDQLGEQQSFQLLSKSGLTLSRILRPYLTLALGILPFVLAYYFLDLRPAVYYIGRTIGNWVAVGIIILLIILVLFWIGFIFTRFHNAEKAYKPN
jgi:hypothetical protein